MAKLKDEAKAYEPKQTHNIAELDKVSVEIEVEDDEFEVEKDGKTEVIKQKVAIVDGEKYRVPNSVLNQLKVLLEDNLNLKYFKVKKTGQGLNTDYTAIPLTSGAETEKVED